MNAQVNLALTDNDLLMDLFEEKPAKVLQLEDDPIALGCASYRMTQA